MSKKKFERKFMHSSRRKLVDMVQTGEYEKDTQIGWTKVDEHREVGDKWEDEFHKYEKKDGYILKTSKNSDAFQEIRDYVKHKNECKNPNCKRVKYTDTDKQLIKQTNFCVDCLVEREHEVRVAGLWKEYENYKIWTRMLIQGKLKLEQIRQAHDELKQTYEYVLEDGTTEKWTMPQSVDDVKAEMIQMVVNGEKEIAELEEKRKEVFDKLKEGGFESYL